MVNRTKPETKELDVRGKEEGDVGQQSSGHLGPESMNSHL